MFKCLIDNAEFNTIEELHKHLRGLKIKQEDYYLKYVARKDLLTGDPIPFKNVEQYFSIDFLNKNNLKKYCKEFPEQGISWSIEWLKKRKESKNLIYPPTQIELRSLQCPSMHYYNTIGGYYNICKDLNFKERFKDEKIQYSTLFSKSKIVIDTREQMPLKISGDTLSLKLNCGDYGLEEKYDQNIYIERKSLTDFINTLSLRVVKNDSNYDRFKRELNRAKECNSYIIMLVENDINDALGFSYLPHLSFLKVTPDHIFKNLRDLLHEFSNFQVLFVAGRKEAATAVRKILEIGKQIENIDLQYKYEIGELNLNNK